MKKLLKSCLFFLFVGNLIATPASSFVKKAYVELQKLSQEEKDVEKVQKAIEDLLSGLNNESKEGKLTFDNGWSDYYDTTVDPYICELNLFLAFLKDLKAYNENSTSSEKLDGWSNFWEFSDIVDKALDREPCLF